MIPLLCPDAFLSPLEIERAFDVESQFKHVDTIFARVFGMK